MPLTLIALAFISFKLFYSPNRHQRCLFLLAFSCIDTYSVESCLPFTLTFTGNSAARLVTRGRRFTVLRNQNQKLANLHCIEYSPSFFLSVPFIWSGICFHYLSPFLFPYYSAFRYNDASQVKTRHAPGLS